MMTFDEALARYTISRDELVYWIEQKWVRPLYANSVWQFDDCDVARLELICELRGELAVNDEALPLILSLLDQLYAARNTLRHVRDVIAQLPDPTLDDVLKRLEEELEKGG
jgi:chaperone modulatory protein CbpM